MIERPRHRDALIAPCMALYGLGGHLRTYHPTPLDLGAHSASSLIRGHIEVANATNVTAMSVCLLSHEVVIESIRWYSAAV